MDSVLPRTAARAPDGRLTVGGCALADVAAEFGTPALVFDEAGLRATAREYVLAFALRHPRSDVHVASKALPCAPVLRILAEEGLGCDVASAGELAIALAAGFDPAHVLLHGNAKSDRDVGDALAAGIGLIVIDNADDVDRLERLGASGQRVLIRINPAVPGQTHAAVDTGSAEAKFGVALADAPALVERVDAAAGSSCSGCTSTSARSCSTSTATAARRRRSRRSGASASTTSAAVSASPTGRGTPSRRSRSTPRRPSGRCASTSIPTRG